MLKEAHISSIKNVPLNKYLGGKTEVYILKKSLHILFSV